MRVSSSMPLLSGTARPPWSAGRPLVGSGIVAGGGGRVADRFERRLLAEVVAGPDIGLEIVDGPIRLRIGVDVDLADLADHPWITRDRTLSCFQMADRACGLAGFRPAIVAKPWISQCNSNLFARA